MNPHTISDTEFESAAFANFATPPKNDPAPDVSVCRMRRLLHAETPLVGLRGHRKYNLIHASPLHSPVPVRANTGSFRSPPGRPVHTPVLDAPEPIGLQVRYHTLRLGRTQPNCIMRVDPYILTSLSTLPRFDVPVDFNAAHVTPFKSLARIPEWPGIQFVLRGMAAAQPSVSGTF